MDHLEGDPPGLRPLDWLLLVASLAAFALAAALAL